MTNPDHTTSLEVQIESLTDEDVRGAGSGTDTNGGESSVKTDCLIPDLQKTSHCKLTRQRKTHVNQVSQSQTILQSIMLPSKCGQMFTHTNPATEVGINC